MVHKEGGGEDGGNKLEGKVEFHKKQLSFITVSDEDGEVGLLTCINVTINATLYIKSHCA